MSEAGQGSFTFGGGTGPRDPQDPEVLAVLRERVEGEYGGQSKIFDDFMIFHRTNPHVYPIVERVAVAALNTGRKRYGMKAIFERVRWDVQTATVQSAGLKLTNNHTAYYARLLVQLRPDLAHLFTLKPLGPHREPQILG